MRLTLRNLLAYLDGILDPADAEDLGKKIEGSEYAVTLVHRIRDVMRRLRLGAPSLTDRGPGLDANTVAEYLDNSLASERVTDFEKVCLDSDMHLAEVAAGHQILTLVLGEPVEVDPESRQRMYRLKETTGPSKPPPTLPAVPTVAVQGAPPPVLDLEPADHPPSDHLPTARKSRTRPTVPDYFREPPKRSAWSSVTAMLLAAACLLFAVVVALKLLGQLEAGSPVGDWLISMRVLPPPPHETARKPAKDSPGEPAEPAAPKTKEVVGEPATGPGEMPSGPHGKASERPDVGPGGQSAMAPAGGPKGAPPPPAPELPNSQGASSSSGQGVQQPVAPPKSVGAPSASVPPASALPASRPLVPAVVPGVGNTTTARLEGRDAGASKAGPPGPAPGKPPEPAPPAAPPEPMGRLMSSEQVVLSDYPTGQWTRVGPNQMLVPQQLLVLPTYRAKIAMTKGILADLLGGSRAELLGSTATEPAGIRLLYGRLVLMPLGRAGAVIRLSFGEHSGTLTFVDTDSQCALDVRRVHPPGANPEGNTVVVTAELYCAAGSLLWEPAGGKGQQTLKPSDHLSFRGKIALPTAKGADLPPWISFEPIGQLDRRASGAISQSLGCERPARLGLLELMARPQKEVRWLSLRCLGYVGYFHDLVAALNDSAHKLDWPDYVDELRVAVARDADTAAAVRADLENQYPQQAAALYRMLWGYTDEDLSSGEDANLVRALDDDMLAVRVLAIWNLKDITGLAGQYYRPEDTAARRQQPKRRLEERLRAGEIRVRSGDEKLRPAARGRPPVPHRPPAAEPSPE
jgi:hypothetical protein